MLIGSGGRELLDELLDELGHPKHTPSSLLVCRDVDVRELVLALVDVQGLFCMPPGQKYSITLELELDVRELVELGELVDVPQ